MTNLVNSISQDVWMEIFTFLDRKSVDNVAKTCKRFKAYVENPRVTKFIQRHPLEIFARFYISHTDAEAIYRKFHELDSEIQAFIRKEVKSLFLSSSSWKEFSLEESQTLIDGELQHNIKYLGIFKIIISLGRLGLRFSHLMDFEKTVKDSSLSSEIVISDLAKLNQVQWTNNCGWLQGNYGLIFPSKPKLPLKADNAMEAIKYWIWESKRPLNGDLDYGFTFIKDNPHSPYIQSAIHKAQEEALCRFVVDDEFKMDPRLPTLVENYQLDHFFQLYTQCDDLKTILLQFYNLHHAYQKWIVIKISEVGGRQKADGIEWAKNELNTDLKSNTVSSAIQELKKLSSKMTPDIAESFCEQHAQKVLSNVEDDASNSQGILKKLSDFISPLLKSFW